MSVSPLAVMDGGATGNLQKIQHISSASTAGSVDWTDETAGDVQSVDLESEESGSVERRLSYSNDSSGSGSGSSVISSVDTSSYGSTSDLVAKPSFKERAAFPLEVYGMTHSWLFLVETFLQLLAFSAMASADVRNHLNMVCNAIYSLLYASILASYTMMEKPPDKLCVLGVFLYFGGYVAFLALYSVDLWGVDLTSIGPLYYAGAWLFLSGSVFLMVTTSGVSWWGSTAFGIGSIFFVMDSHGVGSGYLNGTIGLAIFLIGRLCFVFASRTERVGLCSIKFNHSRPRLPNPVASVSSHGQHILKQITLIMDDMRGQRVTNHEGAVYVEMSLLEKIRVKDINRLMSKPFSLGKVEEAYTFFKGSLVPRCCTEKTSQDVKVEADEEHIGVAVKEL